MIGDYLRLALVNLAHRRLRSWLTLIGIFIGIAAVVSLISIGQGLEDSIKRQAQQVGADRIIITPGGGGGGVAGVMLSEYSTAKLTDRDVDTVRGVNGIDYAIGVVVQFVKIESDGEVKETQVFATSVDPKTTDFIKQVDYFVVEEGRYLREGDRYKATIGRNIAEEMFKKKVGKGDKIIIEGISFEVVGINKLSGNPFHDDKVTIPLDTAREIFGKKEEVQTISAKVQDGFSPSKVAEDVKKKLRRERGVKEDEEDFSVQTAEQMIKSFTSVLDIVRYVLVGIASISLVVGGVGIMNTMYTSVIERTHQIGIMKAVGARNGDIMQVFLAEAGLLGFVGGLIGCGLGLLISKTAELAANQALGSDMLRAYVSWNLIVGALLFSFIVGSISGVFPARKAALLKPVDALRFR